MPLYEYRCEGCGERFEVMQKFSDEPLTTHEKCGGHVHKLLSAPALQFKGSGWYVTDYAKGSKSEKDGTEKKADTAAPSKSSSDAPTSTASDSSSSEKKTTSTETKPS